MSRFDEKKYIEIWGEPPPAEQDPPGRASSQDASVAQSQPATFIEQDRVQGPSSDHDLGARLDRIEFSLRQILDRLVKLEGKVDMLSGATDPFESRQQRPY